jgi:hypothetical protein
VPVEARRRAAPTAFNARSNAVRSGSAALHLARHVLESIPPAAVEEERFPERPVAR